MKRFLFTVAVLAILTAGGAALALQLESFIDGGIQPDGSISVWGYNQGEYRWISVQAGDAQGKQIQLRPQQIAAGQYNLRFDNPWRTSRPASMQACMWRSAENKRLPDGGYGVLLSDKGPCCEFPPAAQ